MNIWAFLNFSGMKKDGVGAKKFGMSLKTQGSRTFGGLSRDFLPGYPGGARKV